MTSIFKEEGKGSKQLWAGSKENQPIMSMPTYHNQSTNRAVAICVCIGYISSQSTSEVNTKIRQQR